jgi:hypothetical protein
VAGSGAGRTAHHGAEPETSATGSLWTTSTCS